MIQSFAEALFVQLVRSGQLDLDDAAEMADSLEAAGLEEEARACRALCLQAHLPSRSESEAQQRRARFEIVPDGGNGPA